MQIKNKWNIKNEKVLKIFIKEFEAISFGRNKHLNDIASRAPKRSKKCTIGVNIEDKRFDNKWLNPKSLKKILIFKNE